MPGAPRPSCGRSPNNWRPNTLVQLPACWRDWKKTLTVTRLGLSGSLLDTFKSTNPIESMISIARDVTGNVKRWKNGKMVMRWMAAGLLDAEKRFHRVKGYRDMPMLRVALRRQHQGVESTRRSA